MKRRPVLPILLLVVVILIIVRWAREDESRPLVIGATMSETGAYSTQGIAARNGYLLWQEQINERGGILGREVEFIILDDRSENSVAIELYEKLITEHKVDAVMGPYGSTLTEAVAPVTEMHRMVQITPLAATTSIWEQGREYLFMVLPPAELFLAGLIDMACERGLGKVAVIHENALFPAAAGRGAADLAVERDMEVVLLESYSSGTTDFSPLLQKVSESGAEVLALSASALDDFISVVRQMREMGVEPDMVGTSGAVDRFRDELGEAAENIFGLSAWEPSLPYPGVEDFTNSYIARFGVEPSFHAAGAYGSCMLFMEAAERAGSFDQERLRDELLEMETMTLFGPYAVDERGYQIANTGVFIQWQDGIKVVVWPEEYAGAEPRFRVSHSDR